jgi:hypothetical protein
VDHWPENCNPNAGQFAADRCFVVAKTGFTILIVQYKGTQPADDNRKAAYVTVDDDSEQHTIGLTGFSSNINFFGIGVPKSAKRFTLHWPDNEPIELKLSPSSK